MDSNGDPEEALLNTLSSLAASSDRPSAAPSTSVISWLSHQVESPSSSEPSSDDLWASGLHKIALVLPRIGVRDLHATAVQGIVFSDSENREYVYLCLLLCAHALRACSSPMTTRWKRWHSMLCETIALYQRYVLLDDDMNDGDEQQEPQAVDWEDAILLWLDYVLPACQHVERMLPSDVNRIPLHAGMVGTITRLAAAVDYVDMRRRLLSALPTIVDHDLAKIWSHPFRTHMQMPSCAVEQYDCSEQLWYWTVRADQEDSVAGMDTSWDSLGVARLAFDDFGNRPLVHSPHYTWKLWFPHVSILLLHNDDGVLEHLSCLLAIVPLESLVYKPQDESPTSPIGVLQLLMNRVMMSQPHQPAVHSMIQALLSRYTPESQVSIVSLLVKQCPHPGMIPRLLDLLRPLVVRSDDENIVDYLMSHVDTLVSTHLDDGTALLSNVEELLEKVEVYVSVLSMILLRLKIVGNVRVGLLEQQLPLFHAALVDYQQQACGGDGDRSDNAFRLNLLEDTLHQVVALIKP